MQQRQQAQQKQQQHQQHQQSQQQHPSQPQHQQLQSHQQQRVHKQLLKLKQSHSKQCKHQQQQQQKQPHRSVLPPNLLRLKSLSVSLESLLFEQAGLDSKFNNSTTATGTIQSTSSTASTTSGQAPTGDNPGGEMQAQQLVKCLKSIDTTLLGEKKFRYRISCSFRALDSNCKSLFNFLRGKGTANGVAPAKALAEPGDAKWKPSATAADQQEQHVQEHQPQHGFRMLLNRKMMSDTAGDSVPLAPKQNVVEVVEGVN